MVKIQGDWKLEMLNIYNTSRPETSRSNVIIEAVCESVGEDSGTSIRHHSQELLISSSCLQRILTKGLSPCLQNSFNTTTEA